MKRLYGIVSFVVDDPVIGVGAVVAILLSGLVAHVLIPAAAGIVLFAGVAITVGVSLARTAAKP